jgi:hypothetical protein
MKGPTREQRILAPNSQHIHLDGVHRSSEVERLTEGARIEGRISGFLALFVYPKLTASIIMSPAPIHEILEMRGTVTISNSPFLSILG